MNFVSIRIITADIKRLTRFYEQITGVAVTMYTEDFGELKTPACTLAIGSTRTLQLFATISSHTRLSGASGARHSLRPLFGGRKF
jgi:catechol 2,3-dioxygenase-like lactoylglutathione lyase family enzyme